MSIRFPFESRAQCATLAPAGAIHGPAIGLPIGGLWGPLAVSPPRSPPITPTTSDATLAMEHLDLNDPCVPMRIDANEDESPLLEQICPLWVHSLSNQRPIFVLFHQSMDDVGSDSTMLLQSNPRRLRIRGVVAPRLVHARSLTWRPLVEAGDVVGVVFLLGMGRPDSEDDVKPVFKSNARIGAVARIEVKTSLHKWAFSGDAVDSIAVVQSSYSPLAMASGMADPSSYLLFPNPDSYIDSMRTLRGQIQRGGEVGYVPVRELCVTSQIDKLLLRGNPSESGELNDAARRVWSTSKQFFKGLSELTADCITGYNAAVFARVGAFERRNQPGSLRGGIV